MVHLRRGQDAASDLALIAMAQVSVPLQYEQSQSVPLGTVSALSPASALMVSLPSHRLAGVLNAKARLTHQFRASAVSTRELGSSNHNVLAYSEYLNLT